MSPPQDSDRAAASTRTIELAVATAIFVIGLVVLIESWRLGARWGEDGPQAGYFPFYIGLLLCVSSGVVFVRALGNRVLAEKSFVAVKQLRLILVILIPSVIYVILIRGVRLGPLGWDGLGIYVASILFISFFMIRLGKYSVLKTIPVAFGVSAAFFLLFEVWFKVPLPKGPLENMLGLD